MSKITYTSKPGLLAREYTATVGKLRISLDKAAVDYIPWCVFITEFDGPTYVESSTVKTVLHTYADTLAEAKQVAAKFVTSRN